MCRHRECFVPAITVAGIGDRIARVAAAAIVVLLTGCRSIRSAAGLAGLPGAGRVRITARRTAQTATTEQWEWTVIGERNWLKASGSEMEFRLSDTYPLNSTTQTGGTQIWMVDLTATAARSAGGSTVRVTVLLRGSNGAAVRRVESYVVPAGGIGQVVRPLQTRDTRVGLPATIDLAVVGHRTVRLRIDG